PPAGDRQVRQGRRQPADGGRAHHVVRGHRRRGPGRGGGRAARRALGDGAAVAGGAGDAHQRPRTGVPRVVAGDHARRGLRGEHVDGDDRDRGVDGAVVRARREGGHVAGAVPRVHVGRAGGWAFAVVDRVAARVAEHLEHGGGAGFGVVRDRRAGRGGVVVPRLRHGPADAVVGPHAAGVAGTARRRRAVGARARRGDRRRG